MNGRWSSPSRVCRNSTGPGESSLIQTAIADEQRRSDHQQSERAHDVEGALQQQGVATHPASAAGSRAASPRSTSTLDARSERLDHPGHDVHLNAARLQVRARDAASDGRSRPRTRTRRDRSRASRRASAAPPTPPNTGTSATSSRSRRRRGVDEADERDPVLRMLQRACVPQLCDAVGADDERALDELTHGGRRSSAQPISRRRSQRSQAPRRPPTCRSPGLARPVTYETTKLSQTTIVTSATMPTRSSTVVCSGRSASRS